MEPSATPVEPLARLRAEVVAVLRERGWVRRAEPFQLSSGDWSHDYVDGKRALAGGAELRLAAEAVVAQAAAADAGFDAVGGLTMGADPLAHAVAVVSGARWFSVRKESKQHGRGRLVEGAELGPGTSVLLVEDVVTTGRSMLQALDAVEPTGATVVLAVALLDRGETAGPAVRARGVPYAPLATYRDLGIEPVGTGSTSAPAG
ncbi:MAG TPA: orotate phosphoribosyltransferase [Acidimicrobiales bacterium]|nr:orotate phosphoribosyltransferase [Acidimicrobiales bacterium]